MQILKVGAKLQTKQKAPTSCLTNHDTAPVLHLFRALLRECTYLPDPSARQFLHQHIVTRFHANKARPHHQQNHRSKRMIAVWARRNFLLKTAQKAYKTLCRANYGHYEPLHKVLALTYGRVGPRRHELMEQLTKPYPSPGMTQELTEKLRSSSTETTSKASAHAEKAQDREKRRAYQADQQVPHVTPQLNAVLRSQANLKEDLLPRKPLKRLQPQIPETDIWGRPTPIKRIRNLKRRWYADVLKRIMPPLPELEWELLRKKAFGQLYVSRPLSRRGPSHDDNVGRKTYRSEEKMNRPHAIHPRFMRRLWTSIFQQCPLIKEDPTKPFGWEVIWSDVKAETKIGPSFRVVAFDDVEENGRLKASGHR